MLNQKRKDLITLIAVVVAVVSLTVISLMPFYKAARSLPQIEKHMESIGATLGDFLGSLTALEAKKIKIRYVDPEEIEITLEDIFIYTGSDHGSLVELGYEAGNDPPTTDQKGAVNESD